MTTVRLRENEPFEVALRRFKRTIEKNGLLTDLRAREFYEKPTVLSASAKKQQLQNAITSVFAVRCCLKSFTNRI